MADPSPVKPPKEIPDAFSRRMWRSSAVQFKSSWFTLDCPGSNGPRWLCHPGRPCLYRWTTAEVARTGCAKDLKFMWSQTHLSLPDGSSLGGSHTRNRRPHYIKPWCSLWPCLIGERLGGRRAHPNHDWNTRGVTASWRSSSSTVPGERLGTSLSRPCRKRANAPQRLMSGMTGSMDPPLRGGSPHLRKPPCFGQSAMHGDRSISPWQMGPHSNLPLRLSRMTNSFGPERSMSESSSNNFGPRSPRGQRKGQGQDPIDGHWIGLFSPGRGSRVFHSKHSCPGNWNRSHACAVRVNGRFAMRTMPLTNAPAKVKLEPSWDPELTACRDQRADQGTLRMMS